MKFSILVCPLELFVLLFDCFFSLKLKCFFLLLFKPELVWDILTRFSTKTKQN